MWGFREGFGLGLDWCFFFGGGLEGGLGGMG